MPFLYSPLGIVKRLVNSLRLIKGADENNQEMIEIETVKDIREMLTKKGITEVG